MAKGQALTFELDDDDLKLFSEEADEQLALLDAALVQLEGEPDPDLVQQIFRAAHTLKGSSATIGHKKMASLTHGMESVLDLVRQSRLVPTTGVVDVLLAGLDALRLLAEEVRTRIDSGTDTAGLEAQLHAIIEGNVPGDSAPATASAGASSAPVAPGSHWTLLDEAFAASAAADAGVGGDVYLVRVAISPDCALPGIRCFQLLQELEATGHVTATSPDRAALESGSGEFALEAVLITSGNDEAIRAATEAVSDIVSVEIAPYESLTAGEPAAVAPAPADPAAADAPPAERPQLTVVEKESAAAAPAKKQSASVRIDVERLDGLMNLVGELVIDRTRLQQIREHLTPYLKDAALSELTQNFEETTAHLARITDELQEEIMRSRMLPVRSVLTRLPRVVRDVAARCGKKVELLTAGEETELDRSVIEEISDPLVHILRNAVDHGIESPEERLAAGKPETGTITVTAWNQETYIYLSVKDDGKGIDSATLRRKAVERGLVTREAAEAASDEAVLQYIFFAGLSTAKALSDISGRGVGMDIVRTNIERLNGQVAVKSTPGIGSEFTIQLPLTLATTQALMVQANQTVYALPLVSVTEALSADDADLHVVANQRTLRLRGRLLPVVDLARALGDSRPKGIDSGRFVVAARHGERQAAFLVDRILGEQDVVVKSLGDLVGNRKGLTGATILGDGSLGLIIDTASLVADTASLALSA